MANPKKTRTPQPLRKSTVSSLRRLSKRAVDEGDKEIGSIVHDALVSVTVLVEEAELRAAHEEIERKLDAIAKAKAKA